MFFLVNCKTYIGICTEQLFFDSSSYIPGVENTMAGKMSRIINDIAEWILSHKLFKTWSDVFQLNPQVDLFATRLNK